MPHILFHMCNTVKVTNSHKQLTPRAETSQWETVTNWLYSDRALLILNSQFSCLSAPLLGLHVFNNSQSGSKSFWKHTCLIVFGCVSLPEMVLSYSHCCSVLPSTALMSFFYILALKLVRTYLYTFRVCHGFIESCRRLSSQHAITSKTY